VLAAFVPAGCGLSAEQPVSTPQTAAGPPVSPTPPVLPGDVASLNAHCDTGLDDARALLVSLEAGNESPDVASFLEPYDELARQVVNGIYLGRLLGSVHPEAGVREAAGECQLRFEALQTDIELSVELFRGFAALDVGDEPAETRFFVNKRLRDFRLAGVDRDAATRARIKALNDEIVALGIEFGRNIVDDVRSIGVESAAALAGLPADWIAARPPGDDGLIRITTDYPDYLPFMRYAEDDSLREALYREFDNRAYPANEAVLESLLARRYELARLTGFDHWADRATADKMTGSAAVARSFIDRGAATARPRAEADRAALLARLRQENPAATAVMPWQDSRLTRLIREERYALDADSVRPYLEYGKVRDGIFRLVEDLWDLRIEPTGAAVWHEDVSAWRMLQGERLLGHFFLDMHPRPGKYKHAAMFQIRNGVRDRHLPAAALVTNLPGGGPDKGYLEQEQVRTFLHEFGHLVHWLTMSHQRWVENTAPEWDFIEAPSIMLQEWLYDTETLRGFATNDAGEAIPAATVEKMRAARDFGQGRFVHRQMFLSALSLGFYDADPSTFGLRERLEDIHARYSIQPLVDGTHMYTAFGHLDGYSAYYYTYMWSLAIALDMLGRFEATGLRDTDVARAYRDEVLAPGGSRPAGDSVAAFLGRPYDLEAFRRRLGGG
jgi:thimet oligopeptidase